MRSSKADHVDTTGQRTPWLVHREAWTMVGVIGVEGAYVQVPSQHGNTAAIQRPRQCCKEQKLKRRNL